MTDASHFNGDLLKWNGWVWGQAYYAPIPTKVGSITGSLISSPENKIKLSWGLDSGVTGNLQLTKFMKDVAPGMPDSRNITGWWYDPDYNGMGFFIEANGGTLFMAWYRYGQNGNPTWLTSTGAFPDGSGIYSGSLSMWKEGQSPGGPYKTPQKIENQGNIKITFTDSNHATLVVNDSTIINLQRFAF